MKITKLFSLFIGVALAVLIGLAHPIPVKAVVHDGQIDPTLNISPIAISGGTSRIDCFAVLPDGKILVSGAFSNLSSGVASSIARLNADGTFDPTFHGGANSRVSKIFPLSDGKILITGDFSQYDGTARNRIARLNSDGTLDTSLAPNLGPDYVQVVAVQPDQKIIIVGTFLAIGGTPRNRLARLHPDGTLDLSFVVGAGLNNSGVNKALVQPDGKIIFAGRFDSYDGTLCNGTVRLNPDGSRDTGFTPLPPGGVENEIFDMSPGSDGSVYVAGDIGNANRVYRLTSNGNIDPAFDTGNADTMGGRIYSVVAQADGKVMIGGEFSGVRVNGTTIHIRYRLFRFNSNGSVDTGFVGQAGSTYSTGDVRTLAQYNGDKILVGGSFPELNGSFRGGIGRLNLDSTLDQSFAGFLGTLSYVSAFHVFSDGKILIAGSFSCVGTSFQKYVAKLNSDGSIDTSFVIDPRVDHNIFAIAVQPDGKILLGGYTGDSGFGQTLGKGVWRINADGSLDTSLNTQIARLEAVRSIAVQSDGKILVAGPFSEVNGVARAAVALNADGSLDSTFAPNVGGLSVVTVVIQPDNKILIGGSFNTINGSPIANFARLNPDGSLDSSFNIGPGANNSVDAFLIQPDNRIYVGGTFTSIAGVSRTGLVRLNSDGTLDNTFKPARISGGVASIASVGKGKILVGGTPSSTIDGPPRRRIMRFRSNGVLDFSFDVNGATFNGSTSAQIYQVGVQPDGRILAAGQFDGLNGVARAGFARLMIFQNPTKPIFDFDGDGMTDISVFRPSNNVWHILRSYLNQYRSFQWGSEGDVLAPADFDGDFRTDIAVFRPSNGTWYWLNSSDNTTGIAQFGTQGDIPAPGDFDGDDVADLAVFRPSDGNWWLNRSTEGVTAVHFGLTGDKPIPSDYDGDGRTDIAIVRDAAGGTEWWIDRSTAGLLPMQFGVNPDKAIPGDYTGDGKTDIAIWRPSTGEWFIVRSEDFSYYAFPFGTNGDVVAPGDYDGDGTFDTTVFRPSTATWYIPRSSAGTQIVKFGAAGDRPLPNLFVP